MKIFLSYAKEQRSLAERLFMALQDEGHDVFFDKDDLEIARGFIRPIREAIRACDLFIFLLSPEAVAPGRFPLTELEILRRRWPVPEEGRVLTVEAVATPAADVPAYLSTRSRLQPRGDVVAEVALEVEELAARLGPATPAPPAPDEATPAAETVRYRALELRFSADPAGAYRVAVGGIDGPGEAAPPEPFPLDPEAVERQLWSAGEAIAGPARLAGPEPAVAWLPSAADARRAGQMLHALLFGPGLGPRLAAALGAIDPQRGEGLRFVINTTAAPALGRLPWEFLYSPAQDDFLFSDRMKPVVRWLDVDAPLPTLAVTPPLRLLLAIAAPAGRPELAVGEEIAHLDAALAELVGDGRVRIERLPHATLEGLDKALLAYRPHVLHFIGHGDFSGDEGLVVLEAEAPGGGADPIPGRQLAVLLRNHLASLRLVFLNSCLGAAASRRDPFAGVAQSLIRRGVPAVIAMQFPIPDAAAIALARHFYRYLAAGQPVDAALTSARAVLYARGLAVEWGAPALHLRAPDGRLFDIAAPAPAMPGAAGGTPVLAPAPPSQRPAPVEAPDEFLAGGRGEERARQREGAEPSSLDILEGMDLAVPAPQTGAEAPAAARPRRGRWGIAALFLGGVVILGVAGLWLLAGGKKDSPPPVDVLPAPPLAVPALPPDIPSATSAGEALAQAVGMLRAGQEDAGLALLRQALEHNEARLALAANPLLGEELAARLRALASDALAAGEPGRAVDAGRLLLEIEPDNPVNWALRQQILERFSAAAPAPGGGTPPPDVVPGAGAGPAGDYRVRRGDSLWAIAAAQYGDPARWPRIHEANRDRIADPDHILPGQRLRIPDAPTTYRVRPGDSLWAIAGRQYGDPLLWPGIHAANREQLPDPDRLRPGQVLRLSAVGGP